MQFILTENALFQSFKFLWYTVCTLKEPLSEDDVGDKDLVKWILFFENGQQFEFEYCSCCFEHIKCSLIKFVYCNFSLSSQKYIYKNQKSKIILVYTYLSSIRFTYMYYREHTWIYALNLDLSCSLICSHFWVIFSSLSGIYFDLLKL